jgi:ferredoxin
MPNQPSQERTISMKILVDRDKCEDHGQCVFAAPDVFAFDDDDKLVWHEEPSEDRRSDVEFAASSCPVLAIMITD